MNDEDKVGSGSTKPEGIGGWLLVPIIGLFFSIYQAFKLFRDDGLLLFEPEMWLSFTTPGTVFYHSWWVPVIVSLAVFQLTIIVISIAAVIAILKKKRFVPKLMIGVYIVGLIMMIDDYVLATLFFPLISAELADATQSESIKKLVGVTLAALIWIPYFMKSKRVKNTFVR